MEVDKVLVRTGGLLEGVLYTYLKYSKKFRPHERLNHKYLNNRIQVCCRLPVFQGCTQSFYFYSYWRVRWTKENTKYLFIFRSNLQIYPNLTISIICFVDHRRRQSWPEAGHREQLILALSIIHVKKAKAGPSIFLSC